MTEPGDNDNMLVCLRKPAPGNVPGFERKCEACEHPINVSYTGFDNASTKAREKGGRTLCICMECAREMARKSGDNKVGDMSEAQRRQIEEMIGRKLTDDEIGRMKTLVETFFKS